MVKLVMLWDDGASTTLISSRMIQLKENLGNFRLLERQNGGRQGRFFCKFCSSNQETDFIPFLVFLSTAHCMEFFDSNSSPLHIYLVTQVGSGSRVEA